MQIRLCIFAFKPPNANKELITASMQIKDIKQFKAGKWVERTEYRSFTPEFINIQWVISDNNIQLLLSEADRELGKLDAYSTLVPDVDYFIKMHITKEATVSSKIEGTQTSFEDALIKIDDIDPEKRDDWNEVNNYIISINKAILEMEKLPISNRLIKKTHKTLLEATSGKQKMPGQYRTSQNWIGSSLKNAIFIPPTHEEIQDLMQDLELFINTEILDSPVKVPHLIKIALIHYQFETIHPFLDGNGRMGRLLITLYLIDKKLLKYPTLYLSYYFERNRKSYYEKLMLVRTENNLIEWLMFFLTGVIETAKSSISTFQNIIKLRDHIERQQIFNLGKKQNIALSLIKELYINPIMDTSQITKALQVHSTTAYRIIKEFEKLNILKEITGYKRNRMYAFEPYIKLFND